MILFRNSAHLFAMAVALFGMAGPGTILAQVPDPTNVRCSAYPSECINLDEPSHGPYLLPVNTTRIEKDALKICYKSTNSNTSKANIVFAVDQSGSMDDGNKDPNFLAPKAVTEALNTIYQISPSSSVGYLGFANGICDGTQAGADAGAGPRLEARGTPQSDTRVVPQPLNSGNQLNNLLTQSAYTRDDYFFSCGTNENWGTHYYEPFVLAEQWLNSPTLDANSKDVIIFVTDGEPTRGNTGDEESLANFIAMVDSHDSTNFPTVYAIFIGGEHDKLKELTEKTGGSFLRLERAEEINQALQNIVYTTILPSPPNTTTIRNSNGAVSSSVNHTETGNAGEYALELNNIIPLSEGMNTLSISTTTADNRTLTTTVNLNVSGTAENNTGNVDFPNIPWNGTCEEKSNIIITNLQGQNITSLSANEADFIVNLNTSYEADNQTVATTTASGDKDNLVLNQAGGGSYNKTDSISRRTPVPLDGSIQVVGSDMINFTWIHPEDPRDIAVVSINILSGPQILDAVKKPSDYQAYQDNNTKAILTLPDTLIVNLTEPLVLGPGADANTFKRAFIYFEGPSCADSTEKMVEILNIRALENGTSYEILIDGTRGAETVKAGDCININPNAQLENLVVNTEAVKVGGRNSKTDLVGSGLVQPIVGDESKTIENLDLLNQTIPVLDENFVQVAETSHPPIEYWIPPYGITKYGTVDPNQNQQCLDLDNIGQNVREFDPNCLSMVLVYSQGAYSADVNIYDNLGKVVHHSVQNFGYCGETENTNRIVPAGLISYLVWNQKDLTQKYVGSGVYVWKVSYKFEDGAKQTTYYKQGVARSDSPKPSCITQ